MKEDGGQEEDVGGRGEEGKKEGRKKEEKEGGRSRGEWRRTRRRWRRAWGRFAQAVVAEQGEEDTTIS